MNLPIPVQFPVPYLIASTCLAVAMLTFGSGEARAGWAEDALQTEADYLVNCSFTTQTKNNTQVQVTDEAYGALNNVRLVDGADWVRPGEGAMAIIGLMSATEQLKASGVPVEKYNAVIDAFFQDWLLKSKAAICTTKDSPNFGGFAPELSYTPEGALKAKPTNFNTGVTGAMLSAMWKYYEFNKATGRTELAENWLKGDAYEMALRGGQFIEKCWDKKYNLVSPSPAGGNLWINDSALSVAGLRCLAKWSQTLGKSGSTPTSLADALASGLEKMKDQSAWKGFFKYLNPADGSRSYGGNIDQLCFVPYETNALDPKEDFAKAISDFWTNGANGRRMTYQTDDSSKWTYFGTRWHYYDEPNPETDRLTPGPGLQLAKVEWKYAKAHNDTTLRERAMMRYQFANSNQFSNLWLRGNDYSEGGVGGGMVDWRHASEQNNQGSDPAKRAPQWQRYIDTSAYFIQLTLMAFWDKDTKYTPD